MFEAVVVTFAHPFLGNTQVKMLVGDDCSVPLNITRAIFEEAERRLHNMAFVGLTDAFNASVCLFHHMYGGVSVHSELPIGIQLFLVAALESLGLYVFVCL